MAAALLPFADAAGPTPLDLLLLTTLAMAAVVWLVLDLIERRRFARPRVRMLAPTAGARVRVAAAFLATGLANGSAVGLRASAATRRRRHEPRPAPLFAAPGQRRTSRRGVRARAAARGGDLGRRRDHPPARDASARAALVVVAPDRRGRLGRRRDRRRRRRAANGPPVPIRPDSGWRCSSRPPARSPSRA